MKMILPGVKERRSIDSKLSKFFREHQAEDFQAAVRSLCQYYDLEPPKVEWFEYIDYGKTAGETCENGNIGLVHPQFWVRGKKRSTERGWINLVYHELGHFIFWADAETKANAFALKMVRGLK